MRDNKPSQDPNNTIPGEPEFRETAAFTDGTDAQDGALMTEEDLDEIRRLLGDAAPTSVDDDILEGILSEFQSPGDVPPSGDKAKKPAAPRSSAPAQPAAPVQPEPQAAQKPGKKPLPRTAAAGAADDDVRRAISDQVASVMQEKENGTTAPPRPGRPGPVQVTDEYAATQRRSAQPEKPEEGEAPQTAPEGGAAQEAVISDDLRSFRGLTPQEAAAKARSAVDYYKWRSIATLFLSLLAGYITAAPTYGLPLPAFISYVKLPFIFLFLLSVIQIAAMFLCVSLLADGLRALFRAKPRLETLIAAAAFINLLYTLQIIFAPKSGGYYPYQTASILLLYFGMQARCLRYAAVMRACRALSFSSGRYAEIRGIKDAAGRTHTLYKLEPRPVDQSLMDRLWEADGAERLERYYVPLTLVLSAVLAVIASAGGGEAAVSFLLCWSGILSMSVPAGLTLAYVYPLCMVAGRLAHAGVVIAGPQALKSLKEAESVILQEKDIFPTKMMGMGAVKVFSGFTPEKVDLCALSVLRVSGSGLYEALTASLTRPPVNMPLIENFEFFETGGMGAYVNGDRVLVGTANFILRSGVRIPEGINIKNGIYVAINLQFAGLYPVKYDVQPSVRRALSYLVRRHITPVLAVRDFNITPQLMEGKFKLNPDSLGYPELGERIAYSGLRETHGDSPEAAMAVDNMANYADAAASGKRVQSAGSANVRLGIASAALGMGLAFFLFFTHTLTAITPFYVLCYALLWLLPTILLSLGANRR